MRCGYGDDFRRHLELLALVDHGVYLQRLDSSQNADHHQQSKPAPKKRFDFHPALLKKEKAIQTLFYRNRHILSA